jgi:hypothetical protein
MKRPLVFLFAVVLLGLSSNGCVIKQDIFLQDTSIEGAVTQLPVFVTPEMKEGSLLFSTRFHADPSATVHTTAKGHSLVNQAGVFQLDTIRNGNEIRFKETAGANVYKYNGTNFHWTPARYLLGFDLQYAVTNRAAVTLGLDAAMGSVRPSWGGHAGLGFFRPGERSTLRFDAGIQWRTVDVVAQTAVVTNVNSIFGSSTGNVMLYKDQERQTNLGYYGALTWNTSGPDRAADLFLSIGLSRQTLMDVQPQTAFIPTPFFTTFEINDQRADVVSINLTFTPGIRVNLDDGQQLLFGARYIASWIGEDAEDSVGRWVPFLQFDITL